MGKTFDQSLIDTANIPMSMIDPEDMQDKTSEEFISMRRVQQGCHFELSNREDFPFNSFTQSIQLTTGQNLYSSIEGAITNIRISAENSIYKLQYDPDIELHDNSQGIPSKYGILYNPDYIKVYPTPDKTYSATIEYNSTKNVILENNELSYTIETNSTLKMPEQFQHLYFDALEYYVLATYMRKQSNPRWQPTLEIFKQRWQTFLRGCKSVDSETVFTI